MFPKTRSMSAFTNFVKILRNKNKISLPRIFRIQDFSSMDTIHEKEAFSFQDKYTEEQQASILSRINSCSIDELKIYRITEARVKMLTAYRDRHGSFKSVNEVLLMKGIDINVLDRFCKSILKGETVSKSNDGKIRGEMMTPALNNDVLTAMKTFTGIQVKGNAISWAQCDVNRNLLHWECVNLKDITIKDGVVACAEEVANIVSQVPVSDVYVMESDQIIPFSRVNGLVYYIQLQRQQIVSAIVSILGTREPHFGGISESSTKINNIYMMRSRAPARLFNLLIGSEVVSAQSVVDDIIDGNFNVGGTELCIHVDPAMRKSYKSQGVYQREQMHWSFLLTAAFSHLSNVRTAALDKPVKRNFR